MASTTCFLGIDEGKVYFDALLHADLLDPNFVEKSINILKPISNIFKRSCHFDGIHFFLTPYKNWCRFLNFTYSGEFDLEEYRIFHIILRYLLPTFFLIGTSLKKYFLNICEFYKQIPEVKWRVMQFQCISICNVVLTINYTLN